MAQHLYDNRFVLDTDVRFDGKKLPEIDVAKTLYIRSTGSDTTGDGSLATPFLTIQKAFDSVADLISGNILFDVGAGTFAGGVLRKYPSGNTDLFITLKGAINILVAETTASSGSRESIVVSGAGWTPNEWAGKFVNLKAGPNFTSETTTPYAENLTPIVSNTNDTLVVLGNTLEYSSSTKFEIVELSTVISSSSSSLLLNLNAKGIDFYPCRLKFTNTVSNANFLYSKYNAMLVRGCEFVGGGATQTGILQYGGFSELSGCIFKDLYRGVYTRGAEIVGSISRLLARTTTLPIVASDTSVSIFFNGVDIEGATTGVSTLYGAKVNCVNSLTPNYIDNCEEAFNAIQNSIISAETVKSRSVANTYAANVRSGGKVYFVSDLLYTNIGIITDNSSSIYLDGNLELRLNAFVLAKGMANNETFTFMQSSGMANLVVDQGTDHATFAWDTNGVVTLKDATANISNIDEADKFCVYDGGDVVVIKNRLGSNAPVLLSADYTKYQED